MLSGLNAGPHKKVAPTIADLLAPAIHLIGTQGTGILRAPHTRLRYDFRRLGRNAASFILRGTAIGTFTPTMIDPATAEFRESKLPVLT